MNFLNILCLGRQGSFAPRSIQCCRNTVQLQVQGPRTVQNHIGPRPKIRGACKGSVCLVSKPTWLTQVRFCECDKGYPRYHRDLGFPNFDDYRKDPFVDVRKTSWGQANEKVGQSYFIGFVGWLGGMYGAKSIAIYLMSYMAAAADVRAMAQIEVDVSTIAEGQCLVLKWRGKPLFIKHRSPVDIAAEANTPLSALKDPETPDQRAPKSQWLIVIGVCTHLGCVPMVNTGDFPGGFYCPCHGSHYDNIGRIRKGPAPLNLVIPPYAFTSDKLVLVG